MATKLNMCKVNLGGNYGPALLVSPSKVGALLALLAECRLVENEWTGNDSVMVEARNNISVEMGKFDAMDRDSYNSLCEAIAAEKAAAKASAEAAAEAPICNEE